MEPRPEPMSVRGAVFAAVSSKKNQILLGAATPVRTQAPSAWV